MKKSNLKNGAIVETREGDKYILLKDTNVLGEIKSYWTKRFNFEKNTLYLQRTVIFKNGYRKDSPQIKCYVKIKKGYGKKELGAEKNKVYYVLEILNVEKVEE